MFGMDERMSDLSELASLLLFLQGAIAAALTAEAAGGAMVFGAGGLGALLSAVGAASTFVLARRVRRRRAGALRWARRLQYGWMLTGVVDMGLSVALAGIGPAPTPVLTRLLLPASILVVVRRLQTGAAVAVTDAEVAA